jgi:hypothetical protein
VKDNGWVGKIDMENFTWDHLHQFVNLWVKVHEVHLVEDTDDEISWNLTTNSQYSTKSAYELQFIGSISSFFQSVVWKAWAPPKEKFFAWLLTQNHIWTINRLQKSRG